MHWNDWNKDKYRPGTQPQKHLLECLSQAHQDVIENGRETHASGFDYFAIAAPEVDDIDLDAPLISRDRRFTTIILTTKKNRC